MQISKKWSKDPQANLFFIFDFAQATNRTGYDEDYLQNTEYLISDGTFPSVFSDGTGLVISDVSVIANNTQVQFFCTGGDIDKEYNVTCRIKTTLNQVDDFTKRLVVKTN